MWAIHIKIARDVLTMAVMKIHSNSNDNHYISQYFTYENHVITTGLLFIHLGFVRI